MPTQAPVSQHLDLYAYWQAKRGARLMPARSDIDPADIPALLPYVMLIEKAGNQFLYRLVGSGVVREVGHDATGTYVGSYLSVPGQAEEAQAVFARVFVLAKP